MGRKDPKHKKEEKKRQEGYRDDPKYKKREKKRQEGYRKDPKYKEREKKRHQTEKYRKIHQEYNNRPDVKERRKYSSLYRKKIKRLEQLNEKCDTYGLCAGTYISKSEAFYQFPGEYDAEEDKKRLRTI